MLLVNTQNAPAIYQNHINKFQYFYGYLSISTFIAAFYRISWYHSARLMAIDRKRKARVFFDVALGARHIFSSDYYSWRFLRICLMSALCAVSQRLVLS